MNQGTGIARSLSIAVFGGCVLVAGLLAGGIYTSTPATPAGAFVVNRFTGRTFYCLHYAAGNVSGCYDLGVPGAMKTWVVTAADGREFRMQSAGPPTQAQVDAFVAQQSPAAPTVTPP